MSTAPTEKQNWVRVNRHRPCPVCEHDAWCTVSADGSVVKCMRVEEGCFKSEMDGAGLAYFHKLGEPLDKLPDPADAPPEIDATDIAKKCWANLTRGALSTNAKKLGVTADALRELRTGWSTRHNALTFPMRNDESEIIGVRLRNHEGRKWAIPGSSNGLIIPVGLDEKEPMFVVEGPTDTAALRSVGMNVIGRPSDTAGGDLVTWLIARKPQKHVVICLENNPDGSKADQNAKRGAGDLKLRLWKTGAARTVAVWRISKYKDVREWVTDGATKDQILDVARQECAMQASKG